MVLANLSYEALKLLRQKLGPCPPPLNGVCTNRFNIHNLNRVATIYTTSEEWPQYTQLQQHATIYTTSTEWPQHTQPQQNGHIIHNLNKVP